MRPGRPKAHQNAFWGHFLITLLIRTDNPQPLCQSPKMRPGRPKAHQNKFWDTFLINFFQSSFIYFILILSDLDSIELHFNFCVIRCQRGSPPMKRHRLYNAECAARPPKAGQKPPRPATTPTSIYYISSWVVWGVFTSPSTFYCLCVTEWHSVIIPWFVLFLTAS